MVGYLVRRFFQMMLVVWLSTVAIYGILNLAPGGPLSHLRLSADRRQQVTAIDLARLEAYLGLDKPLTLRYLVWLVGDDWLGADWMSVSVRGYEVGTDEYVRFWAEPGVAHINPGYTLWVRGEQQDDSILATYVEVRPTGERPDDVTEVTVAEMQGPDMVTERSGGDSVHVRTTADTEFVIPDAEPRPEDGTWVDVGWLFNPYRGVFGRYAGFHEDRRGVLRFDWGTSWRLASGQPVEDLIKSRLGNTIALMSASTILSLVIAVPIGIISAVKQYSRLDYAVTTFGFFGAAMPVFWFGLMMVLVFSYSFKQWGLPYMPTSGVYMYRQAPAGQILSYLNAVPGGLIDRAGHLAMPTIVLSLYYTAGWTRYTRSAMLEVLRQDYVRTARAKGLRERVVLGRHALRNALIPLITIVMLQLPSLFSGATITETVFGYHGMGKLIWEALTQKDWPVAMVVLLITSVLVVVATLLGDILYTIIDPRIRLE